MSGQIPLQTMQLLHWPGSPVTNYEQTGLNTDISMLEATVIVEL